MAGYSSEGAYTVSEDKLFKLNYESEILYRYKLNFSQSGTVGFSVATLTSNIGTADEIRVWIGTEPGYVSGTLFTPEDWDEYEVGSDIYFDIEIDNTKTYYLWILSYYSDVGGEAQVKILPEFDAVRPEDFTWSDSFISGEPAVTINKQGSKVTVSFNHWEEWNAFVERVKDFLKYTEWIDKYEDYIAGAKLEEGENLKASKFNKIIVCIDTMNSFNQSKYSNNAIYLHYEDTGSWNMESYQKMKAEYFTALSDVLNDIE